MDTIKLGRSGLEVSRLCLGCMTFGDPTRGRHTWALREADSIPIMKRALDLGVSFFDTANAYSLGASEEIVGRFLRANLARDEYVLATKVWGRMRPGPNGGGLSRKAIFAEADASLRRLGHDYVDLYQIHRWDPATPIEETMQALDDLVRAGKVRYIGASSMYAWQFAKAQHAAAANGWTRFVAMQNQVNLLYREEEREMLPLCVDMGVGVIPWSPLARGRLARPWGETTNRSDKDAIAKAMYDRTEEADRRVAEAVAALAAARGVSMAQIALAWVLKKPEVTAPIIGASSIAQLDQAVAALEVTLSDEEAAALEAPYVPHAVVGFA